jgi:hypothetical protein
MPAMLRSNGGPPLRVALLVGGEVDNLLDHAIALGDLSIGMHPEDIPAPTEGMAEGDVVLIGSVFARLAAAAGTDVAGELIPRLRRRFNRVVGWDQEPSFALDFDPQVMEAVDAVVRAQGVYRDPELYSWQVGALTAAGRWTERTVPVAKPPTPAALARMRLAVPFLFAECRPVRAAMRRHRRSLGKISWLAQSSRALMEVALGWLPPMRARRPPSRTAQFLGNLTHVQRRDAVRLMRRSGLPCDAGLTGVSTEVNGLDGDGRFRLSPARRREVEEELRRDGLYAPRRSRLRYRLDMLACKAVVSIVGHGEMCWRMAEAFWMRRVLVTQDLSHVRALFPFRPGENVVYCRPDLSDLVDVLEDIECNFARYLPIAEQGHADFLAFSARALELLRDAIAPLRG